MVALPPRSGRIGNGVAGPRATQPLGIVSSGINNYLRSLIPVHHLLTIAHEFALRATAGVKPVRPQSSLASRQKLNEACVVLVVIG